MVAVIHAPISVDERLAHLFERQARALKMASFRLSHRRLLPWQFEHCRNHGVVPPDWTYEEVFRDDVDERINLLPNVIAHIQDHGTVSHLRPSSVVARDALLTWIEPDTHAATLSASLGTRLWDNPDTLCDVHVRNGVTWLMPYAFVVQPYFRASYWNVEDVTVYDLGSAISPHVPGSTTLYLVFPHERIVPPFDVFRTTFRYFLILQYLTDLDDDDYDFLTPADQHDRLLMEMYDDTESILGTGGSHDFHALFAHYLQLCEFHNVDEDEHPFSFWWNGYVQFRSSELLTLVAIATRFIARLRVRVVDRRSYAPGGAAYRRLVKVWDDNMVVITHAPNACA